jgi:starch synthase (maltosyl-transferring)
MEQFAQGVSESDRPRAPKNQSPRIYYVNPRAVGPLDGWQHVCARAADLGFSHVLTAPIFAGPSVFQSADFNIAADELHTSDANIAIRDISEICRSHGLSLMLDVVPDRVAASGSIAATRPDLFGLRNAGQNLDPRSFGPSVAVALAKFDTNTEALAHWWADHLIMWSQAGVSGFRLTSMVGVPPRFVRLLGERSPGHLFGWTPGVPLDRLHELEGCRLDHVFSSLPWWDLQADWIWNEAAALSRIAPAIACSEIPFGRRSASIAHEAASVEVIQERAVRLAAAFGDGWLMPMGFEFCDRRPMNPRRQAQPIADTAMSSRLASVIRESNAMCWRGEPQALATKVQHGTGFVRSEIDLRYARRASLTLVNVDLSRTLSVSAALVLAAARGRFEIASVGPDSISVVPGGVRTLELRELPAVVLTRPPLPQSAREAAKAPRVAIENVRPSVENGHFAAKRNAGEVATVTCDLLCDGHDKLSAVLLWREADEKAWQEARMQLAGNDQWSASLSLRRVGRYEFMIEAWRDVFASFSDELAKKHAAGVDLRLELMEGRELLSHAAPEIGRHLETLDASEQVRVLLSSDTAALMAKADKRMGAARTRIHVIEADRIAARFASWYELFPRSMSDDETRHGTFRDVIRHLPRIRDMGFDVLYFPPIHPIGATNRKGRNNALRALEGDVGSPYAIGSVDGGHDALHPDLGTFDDFRALREAAEDHGLEIALDFAIQCSPDHPWLKQHHNWFAWRPDGSMKYAENPPKKYEDIVNVDFYADASIPDLWVALCNVVMFWAEQGVRIIRVDNPHTKPFPFWEWMIAEVRARYPDVLFLAEAFTRPKIMHRLGKIGFNQSYTYFTWRNTKAELQQYLTELLDEGVPDFFRPNFFVNTPDINPVFLQTSGRAGHLIRAALAATLSGLWGIYCGFELCDATPLPGREEYLDSEKYQIRVWDWQKAGNIVPEITALNRARRRNPALQSHLGLSFLPADNQQVMFYEKATPDGSNVVLVAVSLDPLSPQTANIELPLWKYGLPDSGRLTGVDLMTGATAVWDGKWQVITLNPSAPFALWRVRPAV